MLLQLKDHEQSETIAEKWLREKAPLYIKPSSRKGYVYVFRYPIADNYKALEFLLEHLSISERRKNYLLRKFLVLNQIDPEYTFEIFVGDN